MKKRKEKKKKEKRKKKKEKRKKKMKKFVKENVKEKKRNNDHNQTWKWLQSPRWLHFQERKKYLKEWKEEVSNLPAKTSFSPHDLNIKM